MGLKDVDIEGAMRRLADRRIEEAMREGKFANLPGMGEPIDIDEAPLEENARLTWWALRILKNNDIIPDEVRWRKRIDSLKAELAAATNEARAAALVNAINLLVHRVNTLGTNALKSPVSPVDLDEAVQLIRAKVAKVGRTV